MVVSSASALVKWTTTRSPTRARIIGPGTRPLYVSIGVRPPGTSENMPERASRSSSTTWGSGLMSSAGGSRMPSSHSAGWPGGTGMASGAQPGAAISPANNRSGAPRRGLYMSPYFCTPRASWSGRGACATPYADRAGFARGRGPRARPAPNGRRAPHGQSIEAWPTSAEMAANGPDPDQPDTGSSSAGIAGAVTPPRDPMATSPTAASRAPAPSPASPGLTADEARRQLASVGANEIHRAPPPSRAKMLLRQLASPLVLLLLAAARASRRCWASSPTRSPSRVIVVLNALVGFFQEYRAENALRGAARDDGAARPRAARRPSAGRRRPPTSSRGDVLLLEAGDVVAADARVIEAHRLSTNEAAADRRERAGRQGPRADAGRRAAGRAARLRLHGDVGGDGDRAWPR